MCSNLVFLTLPKSFCTLACLSVGLSNKVVKGGFQDKGVVGESEGDAWVGVVGLGIGLRVGVGVDGRRRYSVYKHF